MVKFSESVKLPSRYVLNSANLRNYVQNMSNNLVIIIYKLRLNILITYLLLFVTILYK